jgi:predicted RNA polymerase sigma factor
MTSPAEAPGPEVERLVDDLFRHESGRLVAILTRIFGPSNISLAEDVAQEALIAALEAWPYHGVPKNPTAWLVQVAKNRALNVLKRDKLLASKSRELLASTETSAAPPPALASLDPTAGMDDVFRLIFTPVIPRSRRRIASP